MMTMPTLETDRDGKAKIRDILKFIHHVHGFDFSSYKKSSITRSIRRRMQYRNLGLIPEYLDLLKQDQQEVSRLISDITIEYSFFFRDEQALEDLRQLVIDPMLKEKRRM